MSYLGHSLRKSYPSVEKQSVYSTHPADRAMQIWGHLVSLRLHRKNHLLKLAGKKARILLLLIMIIHEKFCCHEYRDGICIRRCLVFDSKPRTYNMFKGHCVVSRWVARKQPYAWWQIRDPRCALVITMSVWQEIRPRRTKLGTSTKNHGSLVGWGSRIHQLLLFRMVRHPWRTSWILY